MTALSRPAGSRPGRGSLRDQAIRGGSYLAVREALGIMVRTGGMLLLTRLIGPTEYGLFAGPYFLVLFCAVLALTGVDVFLIRHHGELPERWYHQAFSYLLVSSLVVAGGGVLLADLFASAVDDPRVVAPLQVLLLSIPINILWVPARAKLERDFQYRRLAISEVGADVAQYAVALTLAVMGFGVWAAVHGFLVRQLFMLVSSYLLARYRPRWCWDMAMLRELLSYGTGVSGANLARRAVDLVVPIVVGRYLGAAGVGVAALTIRLVDTASFVNRATYRLSIVALGRVQRDLPRLSAAIEEGTGLQVLAVAPVLAALCVGGSTVLPVLLGDDWNGVARLLPFIAVNYLLMTLFTTRNAALMVLGRRWTVFTVNLLILVLHFGAAIVLVPLLGLPGFGIAQSVSLMASWIGHRELTKVVPIRLWGAVPWCVATAPLLFVPLIGWPWAAVCFVPLVIVPLLPGPRAELRRYVHMLRRVAARRREEVA